VQQRLMADHLGGTTFLTITWPSTALQSFPQVRRTFSCPRSILEALGTRAWQVGRLPDKTSEIRAQLSWASITVLARVI